MEILNYFYPFLNFEKIFITVNYNDDNLLFDGVGDSGGGPG